MLNVRFVDKLLECDGYAVIFTNSTGVLKKINFELFFRLTKKFSLDDKKAVLRSFARIKNCAFGKIPRNPLL